MKKITAIFALVFTSITYSQTEYVAYTSTGKGVSSTFVTDYHALGINPANLGWQQYPDKKITTGSTEFGLSVYSSALSKQDLRDNIWGVMRSGALDTLSREQKIQAAEDFGGSDFAFNFDNNIFGFSFQTPKFGGIALSIRTRASWSSNFNTEFSDVLFQGQQASYFDSLNYVVGIDTSMVANNGTYGDSAGTVISGQASVPLNLSELLAGVILIIGGFIKNPFGNMLTRLSGLNITILMITILIFAHKDWFFTTKLFTSEQIFLLIGGVYFLIKGNRT